MDAEFFDEAYEEGNHSPWELGGPQPDLVRFDDRGFFGVSVLDVGCGSGDQAFFLAQRGHEVLGIDTAEEAIDKAVKRAAELGSDAEFEVWDALELTQLDRVFDGVIDIGLFHHLSDKKRTRYADQVARVLRPGGSLMLICFSDSEPGDWGPRRVRRADLQSTFGNRFEAVEIQRTQMELTTQPAQSWLLTATRP